MTHAYAFFSHVLWPIYVPVAVLLIEPPGRRRQALLVFVAAGLAVGLYLLYFLVTFPVVAQPVGQHIEYVSPHFFAAAAMTFYLLSTSVSLVLSTHPVVKVFGTLALLSFGAAYYFYAKWFISVWCLFAALMSAVIYLHFARRGAARSSPPCLIGGPGTTCLSSFTRERNHEHSHRVQGPHRRRRHRSAVRGRFADPGRRVLGNQHPNPGGIGGGRRSPRRLRRPREGLRHARRPHVDRRSVCLSLGRARFDSLACRSGQVRQGRCLGIQRGLALGRVCASHRQGPQHPGPDRSGLHAARSPRTDALAGDAGAKPRNQAHRRLLLAALLHDQCLGDVAHHVRLPELAQRHRTQALHAEVHARVSKNPHPGGRAAQCVEPVRLARPPDREVADGSRRPVRIRHPGDRRRLHRERRSSDHGAPLPTPWQGVFLRGRIAGLRIHHDRLDDR